MVYMFADRFIPLVESGAKCQTIRAAGKRRPPARGDCLSLRAWEGKPYRSKQRVLREAPCLAVAPIHVESGERIGRPLDIELSGLYLNPKELDHFARDDGFADIKDMARWYKTVRVLPFEGVVIYWSVR